MSGKPRAQKRPYLNSEAETTTPIIRYGFRGETGGASPQVIGETLAAIEARNGGIEPQAIVAEAEDKESPLHPLFEWDDTEAAKAHRLRQASEIVRRVHVIHYSEEGKKERQIAYVSVVRQDADGDKSRSYVSASRALSDQEMQQQVISEALAGLRAWMRRYQKLCALGNVSPLMELVRKELEVLAG
jgi:hypothetical protein